LTGGKQLGFSDSELTTAKKHTNREKLLAEREAVALAVTVVHSGESFGPGFLAKVRLEVELTRNKLEELIA
jgi:hypothetical protein